MKIYIAELLGTFILALAVGVSLAGTFPVATPVIAGMALGLGVYTLGGVSGAHFNPAITIAAAAIRKISLKEAGFYIVAQLLGATAAAWILRMFVTPAEVVATDTLAALGGEFIGAFVFAMGVAAAIYKKISPGASGLAIGGSLLLGISLAAAGSNGVLNPAVALSIGSFSMAYLLGPIFGAIAAMLAYRYITD